MAEKKFSIARVFALLGISLVALWLFGLFFEKEVKQATGNIEQQPARTIDQQTARAMEQRAAEVMEMAHTQVTRDAVKQYEMVTRNGTPIDVCVQAGFVAAAYLQAKDEPNYAHWKRTEKAACKKAGVPK